MADEAIGRIVAGVLADRFGRDVEIVNVIVEGGTDSDDEPVLLVRVVYNSQSGKLDAKETSAFIRHLLPKLHEASESRFPLMTFIEKTEARALIPETV